MNTIVGWNGTIPQENLKFTSSDVITFTFYKECKISLNDKTFDVSQYDVITFNIKTKETKLNNITQ
jgi:hypothetical protein